MTRWLTPGGSHSGVDLGRRWAEVLGALWQLGRGEVHPLLREERRLATSLREAILAQVLSLSHFICAHQFDDPGSCPLQR